MRRISPPQQTICWYHLQTVETPAVTLGDGPSRAAWPVRAVGTTSRLIKVCRDPSPCQRGRRCTRSAQQAAQTPGNVDPQPHLTAAASPCHHWHGSWPRTRLRPGHAAGDPRRDNQPRDQEPGPQHSPCSIVSRLRGFIRRPSPPQQRICWYPSTQWRPRRHVG